MRPSGETSGKTSGKIIPMKPPEGRCLEQLLRPPERRAFADTGRTVDMPSLGEKLNSLRDGVILEVGIHG